MCGISGVLLRDGERVDQGLLVAMGESMKRRGPDAHGIFIHENLGVCHQRLKIIDLSESANQPLFNETGDVGVVFNGEIYNYRELRDELRLSGHIFRTESDTEVLVHGFEHWGTELFVRLNGIFAFAIWDLRRSNKNLFLVRDRIGAKPLFYTEKNGRIAFASELKPLMKLKWIERSIDSKALLCYLKFSHIPQPLSIFSDIRQLTPGTYIAINGHQININQYWHPSSLVGSNRGQQITEDQWIDETEATLKASIKRQIVSDVPIGCFLSGGIDSSLICAIYHDLNPKQQLKTYSIKYKDDNFDESKYAKEAARLFNTEHHELLVEPKDFLDLIPELPQYYDQPFADPTLLPTLLLSRFAKKDISVALTGDGGDELFFGYNYQQTLYHLNFLSYISKTPRIGIFKFLELLIRTQGYTRKSDLFHRVIKLLEILQFDNIEELYQYFIGTIGPLKRLDLEKLLIKKNEHKVSLFTFDFNEVLRLPTQDRIAQTFFRTFLTDTVLTKTDRASMAYGLEGRVPLLDNEMLELSSIIPFELKYRYGTKKYILRKLLKRLIDRHNDSSSAKQVSLITRRKQGFSIPMRDWLRKDLKYLIDQYLLNSQPEDDEIINMIEVRKLASQHLASEANHSHLLWSLISFQIWKEAFLKND